MFTLIIYSRQEMFTAALFATYLSGDVKNFAEGHREIAANPTFRPFEVLTVTLILRKV